MMTPITKLILLLFFCSSFQAFSQEKKVSLDDLAPKLKTTFRPKVLATSRTFWTVSDSAENGKYKIYADKELKVLLVTGQITGHKKVGSWIYYYPNGKKNVSVNYANGQMEGLMLKFTYSGDTASVIQMKGNKANGEVRMWSDHDADSYQSMGLNKRYVNSKAMYRNDTLLSEVAFYPNGSKVHESVLKGDTIIRTSYTANGQMMSTYYLIGYKTVKEIKYENKSDETTFSASVNLAKKADFEKIEKLSSYVNLESLNISIPDNYTSPDSVLNVILNQLVSLEHLRLLYVFSPVDPDFSKLQKLKGLRHLEMTCHTKINPGIVKLTQLETLHLFGKETPNSTVTFVIPSGIKDLKNLRSLKFQNMKFQNPEVEIGKLKSVPKLYALTLHNNGFAKAPLALGSLKQISYLDLGGAIGKMENQLKLVPDTILKMKNLRYLMLPSSIGYEAHTTLLPNYRKRLPLCVFDIYFSCFPEDVQIMLMDGTEKSIKEIQIGDVLVCYDAATDRTDSTVVLETGCNLLHIKTEIEIQTSGSLNDLRMTTEHPVFVKDLGWRIASELKVGDLVFLCYPDAKSVVEVAIVNVKSYTSIDTEYYNLKTSKASYFANGIWVHNK